MIAAILATSTTATILPAIIKILVVVVVGALAFMGAVMLAHKNVYIALAVFIAIAVVLIIIFGFLPSIGHAL